MDDLTRERDFYLQQYNDLGRRFLHLQQNNTLVKREAKRSRMLAELIREAYSLSSENASIDQICQKILFVILSTLGVDRAAILKYSQEKSIFSPQYSLGFPPDATQSFVPFEIPGKYHFINSKSSVDPLLDSLRQFTGVPYLLWTFSLRHEIALVVGNATEDQQLHRPFDEADRELVEGALNVFIDIMARKRAEEQIEKAKQAAEAANQAKSAFLANMSHELRTPLNHIIGFTEVVVDKNLGDLNATQEEYLNDALHSGRHLLSLINEILDISKVEAGKMELMLADIDVDGFLENSLSMFKEKALKQGIELSVDTHEIPQTIAADERKLKQIMYNLLANAVKFTPDGGHIRLFAKRVAGKKEQRAHCTSPEIRALHGQTENFIEISVSDTGIGIKHEDLDRIFSPFEQVEAETNRRFQGTGLGLSLTRSLVELHGGQIWVESKGEGGGSVFSFSLPV